MLSASLLAVSLSFIAQVPADAGRQLPPHTNQEIVVKVVDARTGAVVGNASLEWVDLSTNRIIPAETTTGNNGLAIIALQGRRYVLRARLPDGRQSSPEPVPGHEIVLKLIVPPPEPAATALQPIPGTGYDECCCTICRPVWETCVCNGVQYGTCWSVCEMRCSPVDCDCCCCPPCDCGCFSEDGPCDYNCAANRMPLTQARRN